MEVHLLRNGVIDLHSFGWLAQEDLELVLNFLVGNPIQHHFRSQLFLVGGIEHFQDHQAQVIEVGLMRFFFWLSLPLPAHGGDPGLRDSPRIIEEDCF